MSASVREGGWLPIEIILTAALFTRESVHLAEPAKFYSKPMDHGKIVKAMQRRIERQDAGLT